VAHILVGEPPVREPQLRQAGADLVEGVTICVDGVSRKNLLASATCGLVLAQYCSTLEV